MVDPIKTFVTKTLAINHGHAGALPLFGFCLGDINVGIAMAGVGKTVSVTPLLVGLSMLSMPVYAQQDTSFNNHPYSARMLQQGTESQTNVLSNDDQYQKVNPALTNKAQQGVVADAQVKSVVPDNLVQIQDLPTKSQLEPNSAISDEQYADVLKSNADDLPLKPTNHHAFIESINASLKEAQPSLKEAQQATELFGEIQNNIERAQTLDPESADARSVDLTHTQQVKSAEKQQVVSTSSDDAKEDINLEANSTASKEGPAQASKGAFDPDDYLPTYKRDKDTAKDPYVYSAGQENEDRKPNLFKRLYNKWFGDDVGSLEKISVTTYFTMDEPSDPNMFLLSDADLKMLGDNVDRALSQVSVDEFDDFRLVIPRLRSIARDAAKAVGFYDANFYFERSAAKDLIVAIVPNIPIRIQVSNIKVLGDAADNPVFQKILSEDALAVGNILNHGTYSEVKQALNLAAQNQGYFDAVFIDQEVIVVANKQAAEINLVLDSGKRYRFGEVEFLGKTGEPYLTTDLINQIEVNKKILKELVPFKPEEYFTQEKVTEFGRKLLATQYFNAVDVQVIKPKKPAKSISKLNFDSSQNTKASKALEEDDVRVGYGLNGAIDLLNGVDADDAVTSSKNAQQKQLLALQNQAALQKKVPIRVSLDSSRPNSAEVGLGYGTDTEFRLRGQVSRNLLNKKGHSVSADLELSKVRQAIELNYQRPFKDPLDDTLNIFTGFERNVLNGLDEGSLDVSTENIVLGVQRNMLVGDWENSVSLTYRNYRLDVDENLHKGNQEAFPTAFRDSIARKEQEALLLGYRVNRASLKGGLYPYQGYKQYYQVELGSEDVLSDANMIILRAGLSGLYSFGEQRRHSVVARLDGGTFITDDFIAVPYNLRFFAGGDRSIRGYDYKSLSPTDDGYLLGGENLAVGSFEYNYAVWPKWRAAIFADVGNAYDADFKNETKLGAGVGVRWASPVGSVRVDLATGVYENDHPIKVHFFIGPPL